MTTTTLNNSIFSISNTVDDIIKILEENKIQEEYKQSSSFYTFLFHFTLKIVTLVEELMKDTSGSMKKYVVVKVLESVVNNFFPTYKQFFNENIDEIIETIIESFHVLKKLKKDRKLCCFPFFYKN